MMIARGRIRTSGVAAAVLVVVFLVALWPSAARAEVSVSPKLGFLRGDVIAFVEKWKDYVNELKFPIDTRIGGVDAKWSSDDSVTLIAGIEKNIEESTGKAREVNYSYIGSYTYMSDTLVEGDTTMDMTILHLRAELGGGEPIEFGKRRQGLKPPIRLKPRFAIGYKYEDFDFEVDDALYTDIYTPLMVVGGRAFTYNVKYHIPYVGLILDFSRTDDFSVIFEIDAGYVFFEDSGRDELWGGSMSGRGKGKEGRGSITLRKKASDQLTVEMEGSILTRNSFGSRNYNWDDGTSESSVDMESQSHQTRFIASLAYKF